MSIAGIIAALRTAWALRFPIAIILAVFAAGGIWLRLQWLNHEVDKYRAERSELIATNQATMEALDQVKAESARNETLLADRADRKSKEADRLGKLVKHILESKDEGSCPSMPILDSAIDGL